ncbi:MAG: glycosyltransferase family 4 protein [Butyrivibrio sp.]|nr:glycosyltransferase family 4 protein [Butyrivibrio sp.]
MNILITSLSYYPNADGVSIVTQYQAEGLVKLGHNVTVVTGERKEVKKSEVHNNIKIIRLKAYNEFMLHFGNKKQYMDMVFDLSKDMDIMINVCLESWNVDWLLPVLDKIPCKKFLMIHGISDMSWNQYNDFSLYGLIRKIWGDIRWRCFFPFQWKNIKKYDAIAQLHEEDYANRFFKKHGITDCHILYNAVDDRFFQRSLPKENRIINVGTFCKRKNQVYCMELFYQSNVEDYELMLIGPRKNKYYEKIIKKKYELDKKYGVRKVQILYEQNREDTIEYIKRSKIYMLTSITEMFPVSLIEGMAAGCAFVSTDVGINRYLPGGIVGRNRKAMCVALNKMHNEDVCVSYAEMGRDFATQNCREEKQVKKLEGILYDCLNTEKK